MFIYPILVLSNQKMIKRKVIQIGKFTQVVSLPRKWTQKNNIKKGDELVIEENNEKLEISTTQIKKEPLKAEVDLRGIDKEIVWPILAFMHKKGYDEIKIKFQNSETLNLIQKKIASTLIEFEIIEQTKDSCTIKTITTGNEAELDEIIRKIFSVTLSLAKNSLEYIKTDNLENMEELYSLEETNNKLTNLCERILNTTPIDLKNRYLYHIIWLLESVADDYRDLCKSITNKNIKLKNETIRTYQKVNDLLEEYSTLYYTFSFKNIAKFIKNQKILTKEIPNSMTGNKEEDKIIAALLTITKRMGNFTGATFAIKAQLDAVVKTDNQLL